MATATQDAVDRERTTEPIVPESLEVSPLNASIHQRMGQILAELPAIGKNQRNQQQGFMFRGYDDVLNALNPLLGKYGVYFVPEVLERITSERTTNKGSTMYEVNLHVRYRFYGPHGDYIEASGWGEGTDMADKSTSKAMTMALKYVLFQAFAISTQESSDADASSAEETTRGAREHAARPSLEAPLAHLSHFVEDGKPWLKEAVEKTLGVTMSKFGDLTPGQQADVLKRLGGVVGRLEAGRDAEGNVTQTQVREAFSEAFDGVEVLGPEPFRPPINF